MLEPRSLKDVLLQQQHTEYNGPIEIDLSDEIEMECSAALIFEDHISPADIFSDIIKNSISYQANDRYNAAIIYDKLNAIKDNDR